MGRSRMSDEHRDAYRDHAASTNRTRAKADLANGYTGTRVERERAQRELTAQLGERGAKKAMKDSQKAARQGW